MKRIILDTNFLLIPLQSKVDIFAELQRICPFPYEVCILKQTYDELESISKNARGRDKEAAQLGLKLLKAKDIKIIPGKPALVDDILAELSQDPDVIVATQDRALKHRLKHAKIVLRQKQYLALIE